VKGCGAVPFIVTLEDVLEELMLEELMQVGQALFLLCLQCVFECV
jgi:Mg2+/Co2+ transporter CorB